VIQTVTFNNAIFVGNYTGSAASGGNNGVSYIAVGSGAIFNVPVLPWFQLSGQSYYWGFYRMPTTSTTHLDFFRDNPVVCLVPAVPCMYFAVYTPVVVSVNPPPPTIDTGGFFGPIIKAIISLLASALAVLAQFFGFVFAAFRVALDTMGNFLGVGPIGSSIASALSNFFVWITSIFGTAFSQVVNATNFVVSSLSVVTNVIGTYWA